MTQQSTTHTAGAQRGAQIVVAISAVVVLGCWGLASMTGSLAIYAAGWVAGVGGASAAAVLYQMWTASKPGLQQRTQTMSLGLVGWLIVIGIGMTLFRAATSIFVEGELLSLNWAVWLLPMVALLALGAWIVALRLGKVHNDTALQQHASQHLATLFAVLIAEAGIVYAHASTESRWADVLAGLLAIAAGMVWSWLRLWRRIGSSEAIATDQNEIDPQLNTQTREALEAAQQEGTLQGYDRLTIEPSPAGTRISVRLHLDPHQTLEQARDAARQIERTLESLIPAGTVITLLEPAVSKPTSTTTQPSASISTSTPDPQDPLPESPSADLPKPPIDLAPQDNEPPQ